MKISRYWHGLLLLAFGLAWSLPAGAAVIKNVQTGTYVFPGLYAGAPVDVAITPVNTAKSFVVCQNATDYDEQEYRVTCELNASDKLTITPGATLDVPTDTVRWYVVEFLSGVSVQRGLATLPSSGGTSLLLNVPISAVTLAQTFVINSDRLATSSGTEDERWTTQARLTSTTNLELTRNQAGAIEYVAWQVISIKSAYVQSGTTGIAAGSYSNNGGLTYEVPAGQGGSVKNRTFLTYTRIAAAAAAGDEREYYILGRIQSTGLNVNFDRPPASWTTAPLTPQTGTGTAWFAVRMTDGTTVQSGSVTTASSTTNTINVTLSPAIVINRSVPIISVRGDQATTTPIRDIDDLSWTAAFTSTTNLQLVRVNGATNATISWFVVQFPDAIKGNGWNTLVDKREIYP